MDDNATDNVLTDRAARFGEFLSWTRHRGMSQAEVATRLGVSRQYVTNVKSGDRALSEPFARRIAAEFDVDPLWLLNGQGGMQRPSVNAQPKSSGRADPIVLPLLTELVSGEPRRSPTWDGAVVSVTGPAVYAVDDSVHAYVHRLPADDSSGRLKQGDLILICQGDAQGQPSDLVLLEVGGRPMLAWATGDGRWTSTRTGRAVPAESRTIGYCVGIIWARL